MARRTRQVRPPRKLPFSWNPPPGAKSFRRLPGAGAFSASVRNLHIAPEGVPHRAHRDEPLRPRQVALDLAPQVGDVHVADARRPRRRCATGAGGSRAGPGRSGSSARNRSIRISTASGARRGPRRRRAARSRRSPGRRRAGASAGAHRRSSASAKSEVRTPANARSSSVSLRPTSMTPSRRPCGGIGRIAIPRWPLRAGTVAWDGAEPRVLLVAQGDHDRRRAERPRGGVGHGGRHAVGGERGGEPGGDRRECLECAAWSGHNAEPRPAAAAVNERGAERTDRPLGVKSAHGRGDAQAAPGRRGRGRRRWRVAAAPIAGRSPTTGGLGLGQGPVLAVARPPAPRRVRVRAAPAAGARGDRAPPARARRRPVRLLHARGAARGGRAGRRGALPGDDGRPTSR